MSYGRPEHANVMVVTEIQKLFTSELGAVVSDNAVRNSKSMDNVGEEEHSLFGPNTGDGTSLDPLGELVDCDKQMGEATSSSF
jgi:hypothetical protein